MGEYAKVLSQFNRGTSAMQHYVGLRSMFDVEVMNADAKLVLGDEGAQPSPSNVAKGLSSMFKEITGLTESLFLPHKDIYVECEQASLKKLYKAKMDELRAESQLSSESSETIGRSKGASMVLSNPEISVVVVTEFVRWNEKATSRCSLFSLQNSETRSRALIFGIACP